MCVRGKLTNLHFCPWHSVASGLAIKPSVLSAWQDLVSAQPAHVIPYVGLDRATKAVARKVILYIMIEFAFFLSMLAGGTGEGDEGKVGDNYKSTAFLVD